MNNLTITPIPAMSDDNINKVYELENYTSTQEQINIETSHILHAGVYSRTIKVPAGVMITGTLIKIPTILIVSGEVDVYIGNFKITINGYKVFPCAAHRKQVFVAKGDTYITMLFSTTASNVKDAEEEFTDEPHLLQTRKTERYF